MRTTITLKTEMLQEVMMLSGKSKYSEAIVTSLSDYISLKKRLSFLEHLFHNTLPHSLKKIKKQRKYTKWS